MCKSANCQTRTTFSLISLSRALHQNLSLHVVPQETRNREEGRKMGKWKWAVHPLCSFLEKLLLVSGCKNGPLFEDCRLPKRRTEKLWRMHTHKRAAKITALFNCFYFHFARYFLCEILCGGNRSPPIERASTGGDETEERTPIIIHRLVLVKAHLRRIQKTAAATKLFFSFFLFSPEFSPSTYSDSPITESEKNTASGRMYRPAGVHFTNFCFGKSPPKSWCIGVTQCRYVYTI